VKVSCSIGVLVVMLTLAIAGCPASDEPREPDKKRTESTSGPSKERKAADRHEKGPAAASSSLDQPASSIPRQGPFAPSAPVIEKISGYKTPAEYFIVSSRHHAPGIVAVTLPEDYHKQPQKKYPLVLVFGGAGECAREPREGSLAWMHYYKTDEAVAALGTSRLTQKDFRGLIDLQHLERFNRRLAQKPYTGVIIACPASPLLSPAVGPETREYEAFIMEDLLPALKKHYRVAAGAIGVDGVSMGGTRSMYYGFKYPEIFASIGSVQGAFGPYLDVYRDLIEKNREMLRERGIQLVTSDKDVMAPSVAKMHHLLSSGNIRHRYLVLTGPHDYIFNQGPGCIALLMFHNEALKSASAGPVR
jgi:iron(III)-salmochelin esterase